MAASNLGVYSMEMKSNTNARAVVKRAKRYTRTLITISFGPFRPSRGEKPSRWHRGEVAHQIRRARRAGVRGIPALAR